jgi:hypothetical protein
MPRWPKSSPAMPPISTTKARGAKAAEMTRITYYAVAGMPWSDRARATDDPGQHRALVHDHETLLKALE